MAIIEGTPGPDTLPGTADNDQIYGFDGDDILRGLAGDDVLDGGRGYDTLVGGPGNDTLIGYSGPGTDPDGDRADYRNADEAIVAQLTGANGTGTVTGGPSVGTDTLIGIDEIRGTAFADTFTVAATYSGDYGTFADIEAMGGDDVINGVGNVRLRFRSATDSVTVDLQAGTATSTAGGDAAGIGNDTFTGVIGVIGSDYDDVIRGSDAPFEQFRGQAGNDTIDGRGGIDQVRYNNSPAGVVVNLAEGTATDGFGGTDTLINIENVQGSNHDDTIIGDDRANELRGEGGDDLLEGGGGDDTLIGGGGHDTLIGGLGFDNLIGGAGDDILIGNDGTAVDNDINRATYTAATAGIVVTMGPDGGLGSLGDDALSALDVGNSYGVGSVSGDSSVGNDRLRQVDSVRGSNFADSYTVLADYIGWSGALAEYGGKFNEFEGMGGNDTIAGNGATRLRFSAATAGVHVDIAAGTARSLVDDTAGIGVDSFTGVMALVGSAFGDTLLGSDTTDRIEIFRGDGGDDTIDGRGGIDMVDYAQATSNLTIDLAAGTASGDGIGNDTLSNIEYVRAGRGNDSITGNEANNVIYAGAGNDTVSGGGGNDTVYGGDGDDFLIGGAGNDVLFGGNGVDTIYGGDGDDYIQTDAGEYSIAVGGAGNDTIYGSGGNDYFVGDDGDDVLVGLGGQDSLYGGAGNDYIVAGDGVGSVVDGGAGANILWGAGGNDYMVGGELADLIVGGGGSDYIFGNAGDDTIYGGQGTDYIYTNAGNDFVWTDDVGQPQSTDYIYVGGGTGVDTIADFTPGSGANHDVLVVSLGSGVTNFTQLTANTTQIGVYTVITLGADQVYLYNVQPFQLTEANTLFL